MNLYFHFISHDKTVKRSCNLCIRYKEKLHTIFHDSVHRIHEIFGTVFFLFLWHLSRTLKLKNKNEKNGKSNNENSLQIIFCSFLY